jgi:hypothetical protein
MIKRKELNKRRGTAHNPDSIFLVLSICIFILLFVPLFIFWAFLIFIIYFCGTVKKRIVKRKIEYGRKRQENL